jgi:20S proteasome subunit alpha 6
MEAVKQGSICLGLKSNDFVVLGSLKKLPSELAGYQEKLFKVDDQIGMAMSGLTADARVLCKFMRNECIDHRYKFGTHHPLNRLVLKIAESKNIINVESQHKTQSYAKRPYGVGLLIAGYDKDGPHLF